MAYKKIILRNEETQDKLYPRTLSTELIDESENTFNPQRYINEGMGVIINRGTAADTIMTNITVNDALPVYDNVNQTWNFNLTDSNTVIDVSWPVSNPSDAHVPSTKLVQDSLPIRYRASVTIERGDYNAASAKTAVQNLYNKINNLGLGIGGLVTTTLYITGQPYEALNYLKVETGCGTYPNHIEDIRDVTLVPIYFYLKESDGSEEELFSWVSSVWFNDPNFSDPITFILIIDVNPNEVEI